VANPKKKGLGKGLGALINSQGAALDRVNLEPLTVPNGEAATARPRTLPDGSQFLFIDPRELDPNPKQPRRVFAEEALEELAESIRRDGLQEPVIVRSQEGRYQLVSGERRVRASIMADVARIPVVCRDVSDRDMLRLGLIENIQREDLNAIELASAYKDLMDEFEWTQEEMADAIGKKRATVANTLRLLSLPDVVQEMVADGSLTMGHARALVALESPDAQISLARRIIKQGLSVRETERLTSEIRPREKKKAPLKDPNIAQLEDELRRSLGTRVAVKSQSGGRGRIEIEYFSLDEFERLLAFLRGRR
jgi:ParB family chromosome partitioning protein